MMLRRQILKEYDGKDVCSDLVDDAPVINHLNIISQVSKIRV